MEPRDFGHLFRGFFGFPRRPGYEERSSEHSPDGDEFGSREPRDGNLFHFQIYTDPIEIHRFFEQQMDEMMRSFGQLGQGGFPALEPPIWGGSCGDRSLGGGGYRRAEGDLSEESQSSRDLMLRHHEPLGPSERVDRDLDERGLSGLDLSRLLSEEDKQPYQPSTDSRIGIFGGLFGQHGGFLEPFGNSQIRTFSQSTRVTRRPDGSVETQETVRNPDGSETVVNRRTIGDQTHESRVTTGGQEGRTATTTETFTNMEDTDLPDFNRRWQAAQATPSHGSEPSVGMFAPPGDRLYSSLFDRFFRG